MASSVRKVGCGSGGLLLGVALRKPAARMLPGMTDRGADPSSSSRTTTPYHLRKKQSKARDGTPLYGMNARGTYPAFNFPRVAATNSNNPPNHLGDSGVSRGKVSNSEGETSMTDVNTEFETPSFWQLVFAQSKVNGAPYQGEQLTGQVWNWPKDTFLQRRLRQVRFEQATDKNATL